jgi:hypothetical protein
LPGRSHCPPPGETYQPDSDPGARLVTQDVGGLSDVESRTLEAGDKARQLLAAGLIDGAALRLHGETVVVAPRGMLRVETAFQRGAIESSMHV